MNKTILLVDDDMFQLKLYEKLLQNNGYSCRIALSVDEAEAILLNNEIPDLIISDYEMPDKNGFEFRKRLLKNDLLKNVPFLFLTSVNDEHFIQQGLDLKAIDYMAKDIPPARILSKINNLMLAVREHYERSLSEVKGIAEKLNLRNIPKKAPELKNFSISYFNQSYQYQPGGDFIDFIQINDRYTFVILGDVMGKKWGAWFFSFSFLSYIRSAIRLCVFDETFSLPIILHKLNRVIYADEFLSDIFSTLSIVLIDDEEATLCYSGAGDLPVLKYEAGTTEIAAYQSTGILLGFSEKVFYDDINIDLQPGEEMYLISDGMIDFEIDGEKKSDINLFKQKLRDLKLRNEPTEHIVTKLFNKHTSQIDDCSIIIIKRKKDEYQ
ncbi:fused response regulator/phosphatase [Pedobacter duraquae]|uniref:Sigma-B regulation protein RsbU (Phosphoserine phosphatase) n=1 Tax=Pedobacter duraquae TaxID=425511 RepID=A0A4R6IPH4_9SPHI|nr:fused response regulator/phosphatase [Pedobacter duraquae]TDO24051.1 sigma-B regulation protein RsbU (phosphoserine phosphatase) [Pedobacter duraquae]